MLGIAASDIAREYGITAQAGRASVRRQRRVDEPEDAGRAAQDARGAAWQELNQPRFCKPFCNHAEIPWVR